ncbi:uncharacterized protein STEHIDRAFT_45631, partial [Stereum hirsutum FP-91666 SS1]
MKAFVSAVLGYDPKQKNTDGGILGTVKAYYGCVEAQGRGTLHCHMLIWVEGGLNPNELKSKLMNDDEQGFKARLIAFLNDTISTCIPPDPGPETSTLSSVVNPCSVRGIPASLTGDARDQALQKDRHCLAKKCQSHRHTNTCYKLWKGFPNPRECRFALDPESFQAETSVDPDTGEICHQCLDGMVNNFNMTILECVRCNMDIKFIGSGAAAKAILYYISDYISKQQLKAHVAYAALDLAVSKLGDYDPSEDILDKRAKALLQKCAYAMLSSQELSSQQVCAYLMETGDKYTSHKYSNLYWTSFEGIIESERPSPECY